MRQERCVWFESSTERGTGRMTTPDKCKRLGCNGYDKPAPCTSFRAAKPEPEQLLLFKEERCARP